MQALRDALQGWRSMAQAASADWQRVAHARLLLGRVHLRAVFQAWRGYSSYQQHLQVRGPGLCLLLSAGRRLAVPQKTCA